MWNVKDPSNGLAKEVEEPTEYAMIIATGKSCGKVFEYRFWCIKESVKGETTFIVIQLPKNKNVKQICLNPFLRLKTRKKDSTFRNNVIDVADGLDCSLEGNVLCKRAKVRGQETDLAIML